MRARPILFSGPMVLALLDGRKSQTRRVVEPQPPASAAAAGVISSGNPASHGLWFWLDASDLDDASVVGEEFLCPYGVPGDLLWVREAHYLTDDGDYEQVVYAEDAAAVAEHLAGIAQLERTVPSPVWPRHKKRRRSIHMPRWASRLTLEITDVRVERLQDISREDAIAEGVTPLPLQDATDPSAWWQVGPGEHQARSPEEVYRKLWTAINGPDSWAANPWVWVLDFKGAVHPANVDGVLEAYEAGVRRSA